MIVYTFFAGKKVRAAKWYFIQAHHAGGSFYAEIMSAVQAE